MPGVSFQLNKNPKSFLSKWQHKCVRNISALAVVGRSIFVKCVTKVENMKKKQED